MSAFRDYFRRKYDRWFNQTILDRIQIQSQIVFDAHWSNLLNSEPYTNPLRLERFGFRTYSQNDEDGVIQEIFNRIGVGTSTFVEFGVEDGRENNSALLLKRNWRGLWIECDKRGYRKINERYQSQIVAGQLQVINSFVVRGNINGLIERANLGDIDLISIDIDGNDYWIWKELTHRPRLIVIEYNGKFRPPMKWIMEYNESHRWDGSDYQGASLESLVHLGKDKGYTLVGCSLAGINAFFVRDDLVQQKFAEPITARLYNPPRLYAMNFLLSGHAKMGSGPFQIL